MATRGLVSLDAPGATEPARGYAHGQEPNSKRRPRDNSNTDCTRSRKAQWISLASGAPLHQTSQHKTLSRTSPTVSSLLIQLDHSPTHRFLLPVQSPHPTREVYT